MRGSFSLLPALMEIQIHGMLSLEGGSMWDQGRCWILNLLGDMKYGTDCNFDYVSID